MEVRDLIGPRHITAALRVNDKAQLLHELSQLAAKFLEIDPDIILRALALREALGSTGVGQGIAFPHARLPGLQSFFGWFARLEHPIAFDAIDERPVDLVFLLLTPEHAINEHLSALASASRRMRQSEVTSLLRTAKTDLELYRILTDGA